MKKGVFFVGLLIINVSLFVSGKQFKAWSKENLGKGKHHSLSSVVAEVTSEWEEEPTCLEQLCEFLLCKRTRKVFDWEELSKARSPQKRSKQHFCE